MINKFHNKIISLVNKIKNASKENFVTLAPTADSPQLQKYMKAFNFAFTNKQVKTVAIVGDFGVGKSSLLKSYFKKVSHNLFSFTYNRYKPIYISLSIVDDIDNDNIKNIELKILQQLIYVEKSTKLENSTFKRITKGNILNRIFVALSLCIISFSFFYFLAPSYFSSLKEYFLNNSKSAEGGSQIYFISMLFFAFITIGLITYIIKLLNKIQLKKLTLKSTELEINNNDPNLLDQFIDEIIYFFSMTKYKIVIFEDIDRLKDNKTIIKLYTQLKDLCVILNSSKSINRNIKFVYVCKESIFSETNKKTKFFDFIIPVLPIISYESSALSFKQTFSKLGVDLNDSLLEVIDTLSLYLKDKRTINNIVNEFIISKDIISFDGANENQLFSLIFLKNYRPITYQNLVTYKKKNVSSYSNSTINFVDLLNNKEWLIEELAANIRITISSLKEEKTNIIQSEEHLKTRHELFCVFFDKVRGQLNIRDSSIINYTSSNNEQFNHSINDLIRSSNQITSISSIQGYSISQLNGYFTYFDGIPKFIERYNSLHNLENESRIVKEIDEKIKLCETQIKHVGTMSFTELLNELDTSHFPKLESVEIPLLSLGYIDDSYRYYTSVFIPGEITEIEHDYILSVKSKKKSKYLLPITNQKLVFDKLSTGDLSNIYYLNYNIFTYILSELTNLQEDKIRVALEYLNKNVDKVQNFFQSYVSLSELGAVAISDSVYNNIFIYLQELVKSNLTNDFSIKNVLIKLFFKYANVDLDYIFIDELLLATNNIDKIDSIFDFPLTSNSIDKLMKYNIKFTSLTSVPEIVISNNLYSINAINIKSVLKFYEFSLQEIDFKPITCILDLENKKDSSFQYIFSGFNLFAEFEYKLFTENQEDETILKRLISKNVSEKTLIEIARYIKPHIKSIAGLPPKLVESLVLSNKILISWESFDIYLSHIFSNSFELDQNVVENFISKLVKVNMSSLSDTSFFTLITNVIIHEQFLNILLSKISYSLPQILDLTEWFDANSLPISRISFLANNNLLGFTSENYSVLENAELFDDLLLICVNNIYLYTKKECEFINSPDLVKDLISELEKLNRHDEIFDVTYKVNDTVVDEDIQEKFLHYLDVKKVYLATPVLLNALFSSLKINYTLIKSLAVLMIHEVDITPYLASSSVRLLNQLTTESTTEFIIKKKEMLSFFSSIILILKMMQSRQIIKEYRVYKNGSIKIITNIKNHSK